MNINENIRMEIKSRKYKAIPTESLIISTALYSSITLTKWADLRIIYFYKININKNIRNTRGKK